MSKCSKTKKNFASTQQRKKMKETNMEVTVKWMSWWWVKFHTNHSKYAHRKYCRKGSNFGAPHYMHTPSARPTCLREWTCMKAQNIFRWTIDFRTVALMSHSHGPASAVHKYTNLANANLFLEQDVGIQNEAVKFKNKHTNWILHQIRQFEKCEDEKNALLIALYFVIYFPIENLRVWVNSHWIFLWLPLNLVRVCVEVYCLRFQLIFQAHFIFSTHIGVVWMGVNENVLDRKQLLGHP